MSQSFLQRPTLTLPTCTAGQPHEWRVASWVDFEVSPEADPENPKPESVTGRSAAGFFCSRCLAQVDASVLYAERAAEDESTAPVGEITPRNALSLLHEMVNEAAQTEVGEFGSMAAEEAERRRAALEWAIAQIPKTAP